VNKAKCCCHLSLRVTAQRSHCSGCLAQRTYVSFMTTSLVATISRVHPVSRRSCGLAPACHAAETSASSAETATNDREKPRRLFVGRGRGGFNQHAPCCASAMDIEDVTPLVQNVLIIDSEGKRIAVKYYNDEWCGFAVSGWPCVCFSMLLHDLTLLSLCTGKPSLHKRHTRKMCSAKSIAASNAASMVSRHLRSMQQLAATG
jgi:hypothetical protein